jgi:large subunit ribosomal protein L10
LALTKDDKVRILDEYRTILARAQGMVVTEYRGMGMANFNNIRAAMRENKGSYNVTKNTLFKIALREYGFAAPDELLNGPVAVAIAYESISSVTKAIMARAKEDDKLILKGAIVGGSVYDAAQLEALSTLPTLDEARASLIGLLQSPAVQLVSLMSQPASQLANLLKAYTDEKSGGGEAA